MCYIVNKEYITGHLCLISRVLKKLAVTNSQLYDRDFKGVERRGKQSILIENELILRPSIQGLPVIVFTSRFLAYCSERQPPG